MRRLDARAGLQRQPIPGMTSMPPQRHRGRPWSILVLPVEEMAVKAGRPMALNCTLPPAETRPDIEARGEGTRFYKVLRNQPRARLRRLQGQDVSCVGSTVGCRCCRSGQVANYVERLRRDADEAQFAVPRSADQRHRFLPRRTPRAFCGAGRKTVIPRPVSRARERTTRSGFWVPGCAYRRGGFYFDRDPDGASIWTACAASRRYRCSGPTIDEGGPGHRPGRPLSRHLVDERWTPEAAWRRFLYRRRGQPGHCEGSARSMRVFPPHKPDPRPAVLAHRPRVLFANLLIYFNADLQGPRFVPIFHYALRAEGFLFFSACRKNVTQHIGLFTAWSTKKQSNFSVGSTMFRARPPASPLRIPRG